MGSKYVLWMSYLKVDDSFSQFTFTNSPMNAYYDSIKLNMDNAVAGFSANINCNFPESPKEMEINVINSYFYQTWEGFKSVLGFGPIVILGTMNSTIWNNTFAMGNVNPAGYYATVFAAMTPTCNTLEGF